MNRQPAASDPARHRIDAGGRTLNVADAGCGAGARACLWAAQGHQVYGVDGDAALVALARRRAAAAGLEIMFDHAKAGALPWPDRSMDVCLASYAVAHMDGAELLRVLRAGGVLYITADHAPFAALNWFTCAWLRHRLARQGLRCLPGAPYTQLAVLKPAR